MDGEKELSDAWTGFTRFVLLKEWRPERFSWSGERLTRKQQTSRPDDLWPEMWKFMSDAAKKKAKQRWAIEKPKLDNARQLRGIFFIEPNDEEFKLTMKAAHRKLEVPMPAAMPCKIPRKSSGETHRNIGKRKTKYDCIVDADESTRPRLEGAEHKPHQVFITAKGTHSFTHCSLVHKFIPTPQALQIPDAKAAVEKERGRLEKIPAWQLTKVRNKKEVIDEARKEGRKVHFASLMDLCHLKNSELEPKYQKNEGRVVLRGDIVKDDSGSYAVFTEQGSSASQMTAAKFMDIKSRLPGCAGQAADAVSAYTQVKMEDAPSLLKIPKSECPDSWIRLPKHKWPKSWSSMEDPVVLLERNLYGHPLQGLQWERQFEKTFRTRLGKVPNWKRLFVNRARGLFLSVYVDDIKLAGKTENIEPTWNILMKDVDLGESTSFPDHVHLGCTRRECQIRNDIVANYRDMFESRISAGAKEKPPTRASGKPDAETISSWSFDMEGHAKKCVERYANMRDFSVP